MLVYLSVCPIVGPSTSNVRQIPIQFPYLYSHQVASQSIAKFRPVIIQHHQNKVQQTGLKAHVPSEVISMLHPQSKCIDDSHLDGCSDFTEINIRHVWWPDNMVSLNKLAEEDSRSGECLVREQECVDKIQV